VPRDPSSGEDFTGLRLAVVHVARRKEDKALKKLEETSETCFPMVLGMVPERAKALTAREVINPRFVSWFSQLGDGGRVHRCSVHGFFRPDHE
jgi:hypothetical protein